MPDHPHLPAGRSRRPGRGVGPPRLHPLDWAVEARAGDEIWQQTQHKVRQRRRRRWQAVGGVVAAAVFLGGLGWSGALGGRDPAGPGHAAVATAGSAVIVPEQRILPDGSKIDLKPGAVVRVNFSEGARQVALLQGEAHFLVMKDAQRPFVVSAGGVEVRAVGTAFSVQLENRQVDVLVTEGRVAVERAPATTENPSGAVPVPPPALAMLDAGRRVVIERYAPTTVPAPVINQLTAAEIDARLAWRAPRLDFTRTPLAEALPLIIRHSQVQVLLADPSIGQVRLSGILRADNVETLLRLLEAEHGLRAEWRGPAEVILRRAP
jgi:transmembrane sensor